MSVTPIVITGIGLATSLGTSAEATWEGVCACRDSLSDMPALESPPPRRQGANSQGPNSQGGNSKGGYQAAELPPDFALGMPREVRYLRWTIEQAARQARAADLPGNRCGIVLGTTLHGMRSGGQFLRTGDFKWLGQFLAGNTLACAIESLPFTGDAMTTCSACSSSLGSVALAVTMLESRQLDCVICGGYDAVSEYAYAGFNSLRLVADDRLRPFATNRQGMKLGEGYGILVLERAADARRREVPALARVLGFGESADAHHLTQPHPRGEGAAAAVRAALTRAGKTIHDIDLICAHATGTPDNDAGEHEAYAGVFGDRLRSIPIAGLKSHVGHTLGGAGAVELILAVLALQHQQIPPTANISTEQLEFGDLHMVAGAAEPATIGATLNTSLGFGGANTCIVLGPDRPEALAHGEPASAPPLRSVCISGIGVVLPGAVGNDALIAKLSSAAAVVDADSGPLPEADYLHLLNARRVRRMSEYVKLTLAAASLALNDAGVAGDLAFAAGCSAVLGSTHAGAGYCIDYYQQIVRDGMSAANPLLFAEGVPNAAAAHLSLMLSLKGSCQTILGTRTAGLDALRMAYLRIATGQWDRAIVSAAEEFTPLATQAYRGCGPAGGEAAFFIGSGAVTMLLESEQAIAERGGKSYGRITNAVGGRYRADHAVADIAELLNRTVLAERLIGAHCHSQNGPWIDRLERDAVRRALGVDDVVSPCGQFPELFSVGPLVSVADALLRSRSATTIVCTGYSGTAALATVVPTGVPTGATYLSGDAILI